MAEVPIFVSHNHIRFARRNSGHSPIAVGIASALCVRSVALMRGPSDAITLDARISGGPELSRWNALLVRDRGDGPQFYDVPLPKRCQIFLSAWEYGPDCRIAVRDKSGAVIGRYSFAEIIQPFSFPLRVPFPLEEMANRSISPVDGSDAQLEVGVYAP